MKCMSERMTRRGLLAASAASLCADLLPSRGANQVRSTIPQPSVILLWMDGGPSQLETFAPGPGAQMRSIGTRAPGLCVCEGLPMTADRGHLLAVLRDVQSPECNHRRARHLMHTGSSAPPTASLRPLPEETLPALRASYPIPFDLSHESTSTLSAYGHTEFGRGCLTARRLVEAGAPFVEVELTGWDTHSDNAPRVRGLLRVLDRAMFALLDDLCERDLLRRTLVVWMGDFGRTTELNRCGGRDHDPRRGCIVMAGAGVRRGAILDGQALSAADVLSCMRSICGYPGGAATVAQNGTFLLDRLVA